MKLHVLLIVVVVLACFVAVVSMNQIDYRISDNVKDSGRVYECDYKTISLNTEIEFVKGGNKYVISGRILTFFTDPLTLKKNGQTIGTADDSYKIIGQDDHAIVINGQFEVAIHGNFNVFGNSYNLYDLNGNKVGYAEFNDLCTNGAVYDSNGYTVATYSKSYIMNDYTVTIYDNNIASDEALLMIIASYVSDYHYDES